MTKLARVLFLALLVLAFTTLTWAAPIVTNGSFETDAVSGSGFLSVAGGGLTGWTVGPSAGAGYPYLINNVYGASTPFGNQFLVLGYYAAGGTDYIEQTISGFTIGGSYVLSFALASEQAPGRSQAQVSFTSGSSTGAATFTAPVTSSNYWRTWSSFTDNFVATGSSVTIRFTQMGGTGGSGNGFDVGVDNVSIAQVGSSVPEPTSLLLIGTGLLSLVGAARRRKK